MANAGTSNLSLTDCLALVEREFDAAEIASRLIDAADIVEYYRQSEHGYRMFHSASGALHLALNDGDEFEFGGYAGQAEFVARHIRELEAQRVLEAGCGQGFNTNYLAARFENCELVGVDLSERHVELARKKEDSQNARFECGDYRALPFDAGRFDIVFAVESLCQTPEREQALGELYRVLRPGGRLLVVDVYRNCKLDDVDENLRLATKLVEKTTSVNEFAVTTEFVESVESIGFVCLDQTDLTSAVIHNVERLHGLARRFFNMRAGMWAMKKTFSPLMLQNAICGLLMPFTVGSGMHGYYSMAFEKL